MKSNLMIVALSLFVTMGVCALSGCGSSSGRSGMMGTTDHMGDEKMADKKMDDGKMGMDRPASGAMEPAKMGGEMSGKMDGKMMHGNKMNTDKMEKSERPAAACRFVSCILPC